MVKSGGNAGIRLRPNVGDRDHGPANFVRRLMNTPKYWAYESSGILRPSVEKYLRREELSKGDISNLREYIRQWIMSPVWDKNPISTAMNQPLRDMVDSLTTVEQIDLWSTRALEVGIDPW